MLMDNFLSHDTRIDDDTALRLLEKKLHWLMMQCAQSGIITDNGGGQMTFPDDLNASDILYDYSDVQSNMCNTNKQTAGGGGRGLG